MLVFVDESGDPGFKTETGSSPAFVLAMVIFPDRDEAKRTQLVVRDMLGSIHHREEFKFNKCRPEIRDRFFAGVQHCDFGIRAIVEKKQLIWSQRLRTDDDQFYRFFIKSMMKFDNRSLQNAKIILDGSGDRTFRRSLSTYLKAHRASGAIDSVKIADSCNEPLLQLADMCVGAIARSYREDRANANRWRRMLKDKIDDVWEFK